MAGRKCPMVFSASKLSLAKKVGAEFVGTFIMVFSAAGAPIVNQKYSNGAGESLIANAAAAGLAVMAVIMTIGHISGAHLNPSVTLAFALLRHFPWLQVPAYIAAQLSASICAGFTLKAIFSPVMSGGVTIPSVSSGQAFGLELVISFILMFVITGVATDTRAVGELAGLAIGITVIFNILIAGNTTGASMNPARTLGPAIAANNFKGLWIYLVAPTLRTAVGGAVYWAVKLLEVENVQPRQEFCRQKSSSPAIRPVWKMPEKLFCLAEDCLTVCSEYQSVGLMLCYKEASEVEEIVARKAFVQQDREEIMS